MRLISIHGLKEGMVVGRAFLNEEQHPLLQKNIVLTDSIIDRLRQLKVQYLYIEEKIPNKIETVPQIKRQKAINEMTTLFRKGKETIFLQERYFPKIENLADELYHIVINHEELLIILTDTYLFNKDIFQHSLNVALYSMAIAMELGNLNDDLHLIGLGALFHDVGKIAIPQSILKKPENLTEDEFSIMKLHTEYGFHILHNIHNISVEVAKCAQQHHERIDGSGYPKGLTAQEIHPYAKIVAVSDVCDALTSNRVYREKISPSKVIRFIQEGSGEIFDRQVVEAFKKCIDYT